MTGAGGPAQGREAVWGGAKKTDAAAAASPPPPRWRPLSDELVVGAAVPAAAPELSVVDRIASPGGFVTQALFFEGEGLDAARLRAAVAAVVARMPVLGCRASTTEAGEWRLAVPPECPESGALLSLGALDASLSDLAGPLPPPPRRDYVNPGAGLFPGQPTAMPADPAAAARAPLLCVAHATLRGGGALLALRVSHLVADFGTIAAAARVLAAAYSGAPPPADAPGPEDWGEPAVSALAAANLPLPAGFRPFNYMRAPDGFWETTTARVFSRPLPRATVYHVLPARLAELKAQAQAEIQAAAAAASRGGADGGSGGGAGGRDGDGQQWVSTHDALIARVWCLISSLPSRAGAPPQGMSLGLDMRGRLPPADCGRPEAEQSRLYGNLATTLLVPADDLAAAARGGSGSLGAVAAAVRRALPRCAALFPRDVAAATREAESPGGCRGMVILPTLRVIEGAAAGLPPLLMTTTWALDYEALDFGGRAPAAAAPCLVIGFPIVVAQPAPAASGGGFTVTVWLWEEEFEQLRAAVPQL